MAEPEGDSQTSMMESKSIASSKQVDISAFEHELSMADSKSVPSALNAPSDNSQINDRLEIFTLGHFLVRRGEQLFTEDAGRSRQLWKLFKYLFTYRSRATHPELLMEALYHEEEPKDPDRTLRNLVYRLRRLLASGLSPGADPQYIVLSQGLYSFNLSSNYWLDAEEFMLLCCKAGKKAQKEPHAAINLYQMALSLYQGDYLPENLYDDWVITMRDYYHRIYLESVDELILLLKKAGRYSELRDVCEKAFLIDPLQEGLHIHFIESLLEEGKTCLAKTHYNYASSLLYREAGLKPSAEMRELYRRITSEAKRDPQEKIRLLPGERLSPMQETGGPFFFDPQTFVKLSRLEELRAERSEQTAFWGSLALVRNDYAWTDSNKMEEAMELLGDVLIKNLRKGDIICRWSNNQYYLMLMICAGQEQAEKALERIKNHFLLSNSFSGVTLRHTTGPLTIAGETSRRLLSLA
jgi:DNA-binding SARP family transcriptional activator